MGLMHRSNPAQPCSHSIWFEAGFADHLAPFVGLGREELAKLAGVPADGCPPSSASRAFNLASASTALIS
jgi:hypothetical protein